MSAVGTTVCFAITMAATGAAKHLASWTAAYGTLTIALALVLNAFRGQASVPATLDATAYLVHVLPGLATYGILSLAALNALAMLWHARQLKGHKPPDKGTPSLADAHRLTTGLLAAAAVVLTIGVVSGLALSAVAAGGIQFDHKTSLSLLALGTVYGVLLMNSVAGLGGRVASRLALIIFLIVTLAYPGVKVVVDVILERS